VVHDEDSFDFMGYHQAQSAQGAGDALGLSALWLGSRTQPGWSWSTILSTSRLPGYGNAVDAALHPQYRFDAGTMVSANLGLRTEAHAPNSQYLDLNWLWRAAPQVVAVANLGLTHDDARQTYSGFEERSLGLSATYHPDRRWALSAAAEAHFLTSSSTDFYSNNAGHGHAYNLTLQLRRNL
jgi:hypothetical protein